MNNPPYDPNNPYSQQTTPGQYPTFNQQPGQPSYPPQWGQQPPPPPPQFPTNSGQFSQSGQNFPPYPPSYPQPGQFAPPPQPPGQLATQQPPLKPYSNGVLCIFFLLNIIFRICAFIGGGTGNFGKSAITGSIIAFFIMDWKASHHLTDGLSGTSSVGKRNFGFTLIHHAGAYCFCCVSCTACKCFFRSKKTKDTSITISQRKASASNNDWIFVFIFVLAGSSGNASGEGATTVAQVSSPAVYANHLRQRESQNLHRSQQRRRGLLPTPTPTPSPTPTPMPAPPVQQPVQQQPVQQAPPPAAPPTGVNGNPWGYDFNPGITLLPHRLHFAATSTASRHSGMAKDMLRSVRTRRIPRVAGYQEVAHIMEVTGERCIRIEDKIVNKLCW